MNVAVAGKGGSGKTTVAGTLARLLSRHGVTKVLAIDADSNPNLGIALGIPREQAAGLAAMPRDVLKRVTDASGTSRSILAMSPDEVVRRYGIAAADGVTLVLMARVEHAGAG